MKCTYVMTITFVRHYKIKKCFKNIEEAVLKLNMNEYPFTL